MAEGRKFEYLDHMTDDEIARLGVLVSEVDRPMQLPLPKYATDIMMICLMEEEALERAFRTRLRTRAASASVVQPVGSSTFTSTTGGTGICHRNLSCLMTTRRGSRARVAGGTCAL
jgi:hypothetical protein